MKYNTVVIILDDDIRLQKYNKFEHERIIDGQ